MELQNINALVFYEWNWNYTQYLRERELQTAVLYAVLASVLSSAILRLKIENRRQTL